jgi:hypothetical protein
LGPSISDIDSVGEYATPAGRSLKTVFTTVRTNNEADKDPNYRKPPPPPNTSSDDYPPLTTYSNPTTYKNTQQTVGSIVSNTINTSNITSQFKSLAAPYTEGFDTHTYTRSNPNCGKNGETPCQSSILYGQINPLQKIANDYGNLTYKLNQHQRDLSSNITNYKTVYDDINGDKKYDFNTSYPIEPSFNVDLHTVRHNDSTQIALQSNNMYIAGSMLTTAILISAIYLGRS